jgi:membrane protein YdbS with pleckstrin-like domain
MTIQEKIFSIEKPSPNLLKLYFLRSLIVFPLFPITFAVLYCRYYTLRYNFDEEGINMKWGLLFRREINLTYSRIQDIHVHAGLIQRWLGLADLKIQTASGSADAEMVIEGLHEYSEIRDFIYTKMRGYQIPANKENIVSETSPHQIKENDKVIELLNQITEELKKTREALESLKP